MHLLYVTDRQTDAYLIQALRESGHVVEVTDQPGDGVVMAAGGDYQAIVLDWAGPPARCAARFASASAWALVVVIVASADEASRAQVLQAGADACSAIELLVAERVVRINGERIALSGREFQLLEQLIGHAGEVIGVDRLQERVWGATSEPRPDLVRTCISRLRRKLETAGAGAFLRTVAGHGYVFQPAPANASAAGPAPDPI